MGCIHSDDDFTPKEVYNINLEMKELGTDERTGESDDGSYKYQIIPKIEVWELMIGRRGWRGGGGATAHLTHA